MKGWPVGVSSTLEMSPIVKITVTPNASIRTAFDHMPQMMVGGMVSDAS